MPTCCHGWQEADRYGNQIWLLVDDAIQEVQGACGASWQEPSLQLGIPCATCRPYDRAQRPLVVEKLQLHDLVGSGAHRRLVDEQFDGGVPKLPLLVCPVTHAHQRLAVLLRQFPRAGLVRREFLQNLQVHGVTRHGVAQVTAPCAARCHRADRRWLALAGR